MALAFAIGAVASGIAAAGLTALLIWIATVVTRSSQPWAIAPWLIVVVAGVVGVATYVAERIAYRRSLQMRSTGEPWAYRTDR